MKELRNQVIVAAVQGMAGTHGASSAQDLAARAKEIADCVIRLLEDEEEANEPGPH